MSPEQTKQLKLDGEIFIRATFFGCSEDGDVRFRHSFSNHKGDTVEATDYTSASNVFLRSDLQQTEKPKYDPCRIFKKGDKARVVGYKGRIIGINGSVVVVEKDENVRENKVLVRHVVGGLWWIDAAYLELVTPVEVLEPYSVKKYHEFYAVERRNNHKDRPATYDVDFHPHAKEAAEAECARLNAEYRKEQK